ncbi:hypothetical protein ACRALDRAFT_2053104, partial [Sodiomyces alcalophilus JCM 7366]|uniref:uncharacterized protein n=1 Tax=Sodiomyces alcalophilus JCM 7366 TaxID=591952 RepID=UPI0039B68710
MQAMSFDGHVSTPIKFTQHGVNLLRPHHRTLPSYHLNANPHAFSTLFPRLIYLIFPQPPSLPHAPLFAVTGTSKYDSSPLLFVVGGPLNPGCPKNAPSSTRPQKIGAMPRFRTARSTQTNPL